MTLLKDVRSWLTPLPSSLLVHINYSHLYVQITIAKPDGNFRIVSVDRSRNKEKEADYQAFVAWLQSQYEIVSDKDAVDLSLTLRQ